MTLRMAVPNKGRLNERSVELLLKSGLDLGEEWGRRLYVSARNQDIEIMFVRAQDIPELVNSGAIDIGITGLDQVAESGYPLENVLNLEFGYCRLSVAVPESSGIRRVEDIPAGCRVATSFPQATGRFFEARGKDVRVVLVSGAAEIMPYLGVSDIIVDLVSSGSTLKMNRLLEIGTIVKSQAAMVTTKDTLRERSKEIEDIVNSVRSVIDAEGRKYLMADVPRSRLKEVERMLPGIGGPTVMEIAGRPDMVAIHVVISKNEIYGAINDLKRIGAQGILTLPIDRLVQ
jgi:ATP phosphoribosyltransferase